MRKVTKDSVDAFIIGRNFKSSNTEVKVNENDERQLLLHGNLIASTTFENGKQVLKISDCGWQSNTTKERLNGLLYQLNLPRIYQKNFEWFIGEGEKFTGTKSFIIK